MNKPELESALSVLDTLILISGVLVAVGILGEVGFGLRHWALNRRLRALQQVEEMGHQTELARLATESAKASRDAEEARKDTAAWSARIAEAEARAAEANKKAEEERLARVRIEERLAPTRRLSPEQQQSLVGRLKSFAGERFWVITETNDWDRGSEQVRFSEQLSATLVAAGWTQDSRRFSDQNVGLPIFRRVTTRGVEIGYPNGSVDELRVAQALASGLAAANIDSVIAPFTDVSAGIVINVGLR